MKRIYIVCFGRYHLWDLAKELSILNHDVHFITSYPKSKLDISRSNNIKIISIFNIEYLRIASHKFIKNTLILRWVLFFLSIIFQLGASIFIRKNSKVIVLAENLFLISVLKRNVRFYLDRGSTHILNHIQVMNKLYVDNHSKMKIIIPNFILRCYLYEYRFSKSILVPSEYVRETFVKQNIDKNKIKLCPYGVDLNVFNTLQSNNSTSSKFTVIFVGAFSIRKGLSDLIKIVSSTKLHDVDFLMVGDFDNDTLRYSSFLESRPNVKIVKWVTQNNLVQYYSQADVFILPSYEEGMAMVQLQALAMGLPLIVTSNTGADQIFEKSRAGFILNPGDINSFIEKILFLKENKLERELISNDNIINANQNFSWSNYCNHVVDVLNTED